VEGVDPGLTAHALLDHVDAYEVAIFPKLRRDLLVVEDRRMETLTLRRSPRGMTQPLSLGPIAAKTMVSRRSVGQMAEAL
jgi:hypothetical protein